MACILTHFSLLETSDELDDFLSESYKKSRINLKASISLASSNSIISGVN